MPVADPAIAALLSWARANRAAPLVVTLCVERSQMSRQSVRACLAEERLPVNPIIAEQYCQGLREAQAQLAAAAAAADRLDGSPHSHAPMGMA
jgi:hypothetical protein